MDKIKILHVVRKAEGGMKKHILSLLGGLDKNKYEIFLACSFDTETLDTLKKLGIKTFDINISDGININKDFNSFLKLRNIIKNIKPDIVHMHGVKAALIGRVACFNLKCKTVVTYHNFPEYDSMNKYKKEIFLFATKLLNKNTSYFIFVSDKLKEYVLKREKISINKIETVYNCIEDKGEENDKNFNLKGKLKLPEDSFVVGCVSRLIYSKGVQDLINVASEIKNTDIYFVIAGDGPMKNELESMVQNANISSRFFFLGFIKDIDSFLHNIDIFVLPSHQEGFGISVLEALNEGVPVIASRVGGIPEIIKDGVNGILFEKQNSDELKNAILALYSNIELRKKLSNEGRKIISEKFNCKEMIHKIDNIYLKLVG
ncbi:MAG: glycosyltransferase family 4 protein [Thermoanaerobacteraceae bacterium]